MSHVSLLLARGSGERRWKPETHDDAALQDHFFMVRKCWSNIRTDDAICFLLADNNQMVFRKEWNEFRRDRGFSLARAESCWVQARRAWQLLIILVRGKEGTRASLLRHSQPTCRTSPSRPKTLRVEVLREDSCVAKQTVWPPYITCLGNKSWIHPHRFDLVSEMTFLADFWWSRVEGLSCTEQVGACGTKCQMIWKSRMKMCVLRCLRQRYETSRQAESGRDEWSRWNMRPVQSTNERAR